ncbi:carbohydrate ABC transporter permease [Lacicoccus alkaliphilus]|uniref:Carbohydrate ABC transporter membrane protein 1, CUT1 family (TC 3.A.1.1.-) n=1 Tax=Lacicoccus alkaliphilus DSM 16010 TaxID=1123231 RepID=A0A1M7E4I8_9BACL|nr:sugar ABC transporter permease [Salinicoccus alkaliphilus]SHL86329.1 carbohydrate ABC transporter membrane protein 1, CUT1 family (TC 3.A.1.1.-) [Salinicoccus alkaliphilus DSM 16010]
MNKKKENLFGYIFISPWIIGFLALTLGPLLFSLYGSFTNYNVVSRMDFVGFDNYQELFTNDNLFWVSLYNTFYFVIFSVPLTTILAILISTMMNQDIPGMRIFRTIYYLPAILSGVGVYLLWMQLLDPSTGLINQFLALFGINGPNWLFDPDWAKPSLIFMKLWSAGGAMLLYLAAMQGIPKTFYEAARIDGATNVQMFFKITLPMVSPIIFFDVITSTIGSFQIFQEAYVMSADNAGAPENSLLFFNLYMWIRAFNLFDMGYAMAMSWILFIIVLLLTLVNFKLSKRWVHYEGD